MGLAFFLYLTGRYLLLLQVSCGISMRFLNLHVLWRGDKEIAAPDELGRRKALFRLAGR
jgi:hypothetical protein